MNVEFVVKSVPEPTLVAALPMRTSQPVVGDLVGVATVQGEAMYRVYERTFQITENEDGGGASIKLICFVVMVGLLPRVADEEGPEGDGSG